MDKILFRLIYRTMNKIIIDHYNYVRISLLQIYLYYIIIFNKHINKIIFGIVPDNENSNRRTFSTFTRNKRA